MSKTAALFVSALAAGAAWAAVACSSSSAPPEPTAETESAFTRQVPGELLTQHNDTYRTGQNPRERVLTPDNVKVSTFGKLFDIAGIEGQVYAQPLYVPHVKTLTRGVRDLLVVVTEENWVYAFDAQMVTPDDPPLWSAHLGDPLREEEVSPVVLHNARPHVGITSTPAVRQTGRSATMFLSSLQASYGGQGGLLDAHWVAYEIDVGSGGILAHQVMDPSLVGPDGQPVPFHAQDYMQRPGVLLTGDLVVFGFSTNLAFDLVDDAHPPYHGFVIALSRDDLSLQGLFDTTYASTGAGVWQAGNGIAADRSGRIYLMTANETHSAAGSLVPSIYGDAVVELKMTRFGLLPFSTFRPSNADSLAELDGDLGSSGPLVLPGAASNVIGGGKPAVLYVMRPDDLGGYTPSADGGVDPSVERVLQRIDVAVAAGVGPGSYQINASPVYWSPAASLYLWPGNGWLMKWDVDPVAGLLKTGTLDVNRARQASIKGGIMSLSSNGRQDGILWVNVTGGGSTDGTLNDETSSLLAAYGATDIHHELWASDGFAGDAVPGGARFSTPTVAGGRVYLGGYFTKPGYDTPADSNGGIIELPSGFVSVYGLREVPLPPPGQGPDSGGIDAASGDAAADAPACGDPMPMTWTYLYDTYFRYSDATTPAIATPGHCAQCHAKDSTGPLAALARANWLITGSTSDPEPVARETLYTSMLAPAPGLGGAPLLVTGADAATSRLTTILKWYGATGPTAMPADDTAPVSAECAKAAVDAWLAAGAPDD